MSIQEGCMEFGYELHIVISKRIITIKCNISTSVIRYYHTYLVM